MCALIPAAGRGVRFGSSQNKVFAPLLGRPLLAWTLEAFARCAAVDSLLLIGSEADLPRLREIGERYGGGKLLGVAAGGADRQASVRNGLADLPEGIEYVVVHDGARPCVTPELIAETLRRARHVGGAATAAVPVTDTLVRESGPAAKYGDDLLGLCGDQVPRDGLWAIQTPQAFHLPRLCAAHARAADCGYQGTDDTGVFREMSEDRDAVYLTPSTPENLKVTRPEDLALAEAILARRSPPPPFRIGYGYDVHPFADGRPLYLGGVHFPEASRGLQGHSDADVLLHAVCDALLGAAGLGDIGKLFPPSDMRHKDRRSTEFLADVGERIQAAGWGVGNIDVMVLAETPKIGPRAEEIQRVIAETLGASPETISIKATTNEGLGFVGRGEGIAVHATALLMRRDFGTGAA